MASNFRLDTSVDGEGSPRLYSRGDNNPTWESFEAAVAAIEGGGRSVAFSSGMAAIAAVFGRMETGARVVAPSDCYQGVAAMLSDGESRNQWSVRRLPTDETGLWLDALETEPDLVWLESPSNPMMRVADVPAICTRAAKLGVDTAVDCTFATPLLLRPLDVGATFSVHSATKFMGGHSDLLGGVVTTRHDDAAERLRRYQTVHGATMGTMEAFLALRGLRTLPLRLHRAQASARELAVRLHNHRAVTTVHYPGLESDPGHNRAAGTMAGPGAVLSFQTVGRDVDLDQALAGLDIVVVATSLGGVESTIERRARLAGQEQVPPTLVRLSVGCEHLEDLWRDLDAMLGRLQADTGH